MKRYQSLTIVIIAIILLVLLLWSLKSPMISMYLSNKLKTKVSVERSTLSLSEIKLKNFVIKNPVGKSKAAFLGKNVDVNYGNSTIFSSPKVIEKVLVEDAILNINCESALCTKNNWTMIIEDMNKKASKKEDRTTIKSFVIKNLDINIEDYEGLKFSNQKNIHIDYLEFKNIISLEGFPIEQFIVAIFRSAGLKDYLQDILDQKGFWERFLAPFKELGSNQEVSN